MTTIVLAAGYGTRLYPLTLNKPKALLEVGGKAILDRLFEKIEAVDRPGKAVIVTNEKFYKNFKKWQSRYRSNIDIKVINDKTKSDETRLGAIGDINLVLEETGTSEDLLIMGSDNLFREDLGGFVKFSVAKRPFSALALFDIKNKKLAAKYGICDLNEDSQVVGFEEKPTEPKTTLAASALYFIPKEKASRVREYMKTDLSKDAPGNLMKWLSREDKVFGYVLKGAWYDIGDTESLRKADEEFNKKGGS